MVTAGPRTLADAAGDTSGGAECVPSGPMLPADPGQLQGEEDEKQGADDDQTAGIGRATLYKYFPDVEAILHAWHERQIARHLEQLAEIRDGSVSAGDRLEAVLQTYAAIMHQRAQHSADLGTLLHRTHSGERADHAQQQLHDMIRDLLTEGASSGNVRDDVAPEELATFCLHALAAAGSLPSEDAVRRLVMLTLVGVHQ